MQHPDDDRDPDEREPHAELLPGQERAVTRLLADARAGEVMPPEVVARLDDVLAGLAAEQGHRAPVVDLAARRRTRRARLLVAAAAVVAAGVVLPSVLLQQSGSDGAGDASESTAASESGTGSDTGSDDKLAPHQDAPGAGAAEVGPARIRSDHFAADVRRAAPLLESAEREVSSADGALGQLGAIAASSAACVPEDAVGVLVEASYDGRDGVLLMGPEVSGERRYDLFVCTDPQVGRSVVLPTD